MQPLERQHSPGSGRSSAALLAPELQGHCHVLPTHRRVGSRHGGFTPRSAGLQPWSPCTPMSGDTPPPQTQRCSDVQCAQCSRQQCCGHRAAAPSTAMPGTHHSDVRLPPWPSHPVLHGKQGAHHPGVPALPSPGTGAKPYSRWLQAGCRQACRQAAGRCTVFRALAGLRGSSSRACLLKGNTRLSQPPACSPELGWVPPAPGLPTMPG